MSDIGAAGKGRSKLTFRWRPRSPGFCVWAGVLLALGAAYSAIYLSVAFFRSPVWPPGDSMALWTWARFLVTHPAAEIYRPASLHAAQAALGLPAAKNYPFAYPPSFLLPLWLLGQLGRSAAFWMLIASTLPLYLWATVGQRWRSPTTLAALVAPTTVIAIVSGQTDFLAAALLIGGFRLVSRHPLLGGVLFGLMTYKPQLGLLVPIALVSAGAWRCIVAACVTVVALVAVSSAAFGWHIWLSWLLALPGFSAAVTMGQKRLLHLMPTILAGMLEIGASPMLARLAQLAAAIATAGIVWVVFRAGPRRLAVAALLVATFFATPYAFVYDLPIAGTAVLWVVIDRDARGGAFGLFEILILTIAAIAPMTMPTGMQGRPLGLISLLLVLAMILRSLWVQRPEVKRGRGNAF